MITVPVCVCSLPHDSWVELLPSGVTEALQRNPSTPVAIILQDGCMYTNLLVLSFFILISKIVVNKKYSCYFVLNFSIIRFRYGHKKRTKETSRSPLFTGFAVRFARAYARRKKCVIYVCSTRESIQIFGTTKLFAIFFSFLDVKESNATARVFTPLLYKAQTLAGLKFIVCNIIINWVNSHSTGAKVRRNFEMTKE